MTRNSAFWKLTLVVATATALFMLNKVMGMSSIELMNLYFYLLFGYGILYSTVVTFLLVIFLPEKRLVFSYWVKVWIIMTLSVHWIVPYVLARASFF